MLDFRLLGALDLTPAPGRGGATLIAQPRRLALLAYLAVATPRGPHRRDTLLGLFWPDLDATRARAALRQSLHVLRDVLGPTALVRRGNEEVGLNFDVIRCDVGEFDAAVEAGRLTEALELYRGDLLEGFFISDAPEFERWQEQERARLREAACHSAETLCERAEARRDLSGAAMWARRAARFAPHDEGLLRRLVSLLDLQGDRAGALQAYEEFARRLSVEFESQPSAETQALIAAVRARAATPTRRPATVTGRVPSVRHTVGRERERAGLHEGFEDAADGHGQLWCVAGESGIGKTTLVESFLADLSAGGSPCYIARGHCSERLAGTEAYLPLLEALQSLLQGDTRETIVRAVQRAAPTWEVQLSPSSSGVAVIPGRDVPVSQTRMKLELTALLEEVSAQRPLVLFFDDVQWIDPSTVDLLAFLGARLATLPLFIVVAYRPSEMLLAQNVFWPVKLDLQARGVCRELPLEFLTREAVADYLALEFPAHGFPPTFPEKVHARTEGSPLFMVDLLRYLRDHDVIVQTGGRWALADSLPDIERGLPESVRSMIQRKMGQLAPADRRVLVVASVQGQEFDSAVVAKALTRDPAGIEERLEALDRVHGFVRPVQQARPGRVQSVRYRFVHLLYQNALYASLAPTRRASLSAAVAEALDQFHAGTRSAVASELALLYEVGRDPERAAGCFLLAAENALHLCAVQEAATLAQRGLELLQTAPPSTARARAELALQIALSVSLTVSKGWAVAQVEAAYQRAHQLCEQVGEPSQRFRVLAGMWRVNIVHARLRIAREMAEELLKLAESLGDPALQVEAHQALAYPASHSGEHVAANEHAKRGLALYDSQHFYGNSLLLTQDPGVDCHNQAARSLWVLGYPDQAEATTRAAIALAEGLAQPTSRGWAYLAAGIMYQLRREPTRSLEYWEATIRVSQEHSLSQFLAWGKAWRGWARAKLGYRPEGVAEMREGLGELRAMETTLTRPQCNALLAEILTEDGHVDDALALITDAQAIVREFGAGYYEAELYRLTGDALLRSTARVADAEGCYRQAMEIARGRCAKSFELRAALSLAQLYERQRRRDEARGVLGNVFSWFTEGFDTPDLRDASVLLDQLS